jgi:peptide deformylase
MAILKVARMGHPVLRAPSERVLEEDIRKDATQRLIEDMIETCREYDGAGLAAPQVHVPLRVVLMEVHDNPRYPDAEELALTIVINPEIEHLDATHQMVWEGCLSVPDLRGLVPRSRRVRLRGLDRTGAPLDITLEGFPAAVVQHECDHLDGRLFIDRMGDLTTLSFLPEFNRYRRSLTAAPINED